jgi:hypothetical protein
MLEGFPMPKVYLRTVIDTKTQQVIRDVVDGQQRIRTILAFARNDLRLNRRSERFRGLTYEELDENLKQRFLGYLIGVEHLQSATNGYVLETFARLNSYTVALNAAELRHAKYQSEFKWEIHELAEQLRPFFTDHGILTTREVVRMGDDTLTAEMAGIAVGGVGDGGAAILDRLYKRYDKAFPESDKITKLVRSTCDWLNGDLSRAFSIPTLARAPQFLMLFAAAAHQLHGIPHGAIDPMPPRVGVDSISNILDRLSILAEAIEQEDVSGPYRDFVLASSRATTRIDSRRPRFRAFNDAVVLH